MSEKSDQEKLKREILSLSQEKVDYEVAKDEWELDKITYGDKDKCACDHDIWQNCHIVNKNNGNKAIVGNVCIKQFFGWDMTGVFSCLRAIQKDLDTPWNAALAMYLDHIGAIQKSELAWAITNMTQAAYSKKMTLARVRIRRGWNIHILGLFNMKSERPESFYENRDKQRSEIIKYRDEERRKKKLLREQEPAQ